MEEEQKSISFSMFNTNDIIIDDFYVKLNSPNSDIDVPTYIRTNLYALLKIGVEEKNKRALEVTIDKTFLAYLLQMTNDKTIKIDDESKIRINHICYDYIKNRADDDVVLNRLIDITCNLNMKMVQIMMGFYLSKEQAVYLVAARYSSSDLNYCYKRTIMTMQLFPSVIMTEENMVDILGKLCKDSVSTLFVHIQSDFRKFPCNNDEEYVYSTLTLAILDIVESLPLEGIYTVLSRYLDILPTFKTRPRFMLKSVSVGDYPRYNHIVDVLEEEGRYIF